MMIFDSLIAWKIPRLARYRVVALSRYGEHDLPHVRFCTRRNAERWTAQSNTRYAAERIRFEVRRLAR